MKDLQTLVSEKQGGYKAIFEQIYPHARLLYIKARSKKKKNQAMQDITPTKLAERLGDTSIQFRNEISKAIYETYQCRVSEFERRFGVEVTAPQMMRMEIFEEIEKRKVTMNAFSAKNVWGDKIRFSYMDLIRGIKVPLTLDYLTSFLITTLMHKDDKNRTTKKIQFKPNDKNREYFDTVIFPMVYDHFNLGVNTGHKPRPLSFKNTGISITSPAITTFIDTLCSEGHDLPNFEKINEQCELNQKSMRDIHESAFYAVINREGRVITPLGRKQYILISKRHNLAYLEELQKLAEQLGYRTEIHRTKGALYVPSETVKKLAETDYFQRRGFEYKTLGAFVNPHLIKQLS